MDRQPGIPFRPWKHPMVWGCGLMLAASWATMAADNFVRTYDPRHLHLRVRASCNTTPGVLFIRAAVEWDGKYYTDVRCPSPEDLKKYPNQPWKWSAKRRIDVTQYIARRDQEKPGQTP